MNYQILMKIIAGLPGTSPFGDLDWFQDKISPFTSTDGWMYLGEDGFRITVRGCVIIENPEIPSRVTRIKGNPSYCPYRWGLPGNGFKTYHVEGAYPVHGDCATLKNELRRYFKSHPPRVDGAESLRKKIMALEKELRTLRSAEVVRSLEIHERVTIGSMIAQPLSHAGFTYMGGGEWMRTDPGNTREYGVSVRRSVVAAELGIEENLILKWEKADEIADMLGGL